MDKYILDENGDPVLTHDVLVWGRFMEDGDNRRVAHTEVDGAEVSTVFLGMNHGFRSPVPILYETLVFGGPQDGHMQRYATRCEAEEGHKKVVEIVRGNP